MDYKLVQHLQGILLSAHILGTYVDRPIRRCRVKAKHVDLGNYACLRVALLYVCVQGLNHGCQMPSVTSTRHSQDYIQQRIREATVRPYF